MNIEFLFDQALTIGGTGLMAAMGWALKKFSDLLATRSKSESMAAFWRRLDDLAMRVVRDTYQAYVSPLQAAGEWTPEAAKKARAGAIDKLKTYLGVPGLRSVAYLFGQDQDSSLDRFLGTFIESAVMESKMTAALPAMPEAALSPSPLQAPGAP